MSKANKKKSAKEKRVLAGALCIAAVIAAGSTFAWFTSEDEVTNRLSANADYEVSIVESFTPPANWIPGQNINKDVYAINTGNIAAFVNEDVSGVLTYTVEKKVSAFDADCVKLTADEVDVMKAGAYLAGAFAQTGGTALAGVTAGNIAEYFNNGAGTDPKTTDDFTPTTAGLYFFRRSIGVKAADQTETFTYQGYYFDGSGNYYKLADIAINEIPTGTAGDGITTDGNLTKAPTVMYANETTATVTPTLKYEEKSTETGKEHPARLVATYNTMGADGATAEQATAVDNADKAVTGTDGALKALNDAKIAYNTAKSEYETASGTYNTALTTIAYYAGEANAEAITRITDFSYVGTDTVIGSAELLTNTSIVSPGILRGQIDNYNTLVGQFNALSSQIATATSTVSTKEATLTSKSDAVNNSSTGTKKQFDDAKAAYNSTLGQDYDADIAEIGTPSTTDDIYVVWQKEQAYNNSLAELATAQSEYDDAVNALADLNNQAASLRSQLIALGNTISANVTALNAAIDSRTANANAEGDVADANSYAGKKKAYEDALAAYNAALATYNAARATYEAADNTDGNLVIYINLSDDVVTTANAKDKWQLIPITSGADADTTAHFYYTGILQAGESSAKLIDSVELADSVKKEAYKSFDFDLNVHLDSAQITYADDQKTITAAAVTAQSTAFESRQANLTTPTDIETPVLWS